MSLSIDESNIQVYSGKFSPGSDYKKFDIVSHPDTPGVFYYAKEDILVGGAFIGSLTLPVGADRFTFDGNANTITDTSSTDAENFIIKGFKAGQVIEVAGSTANNHSFVLESVSSNTLTVFDKAPLITTEDASADNKILIEVVDQIPGDSSNQLWSQNEFFFDADYGATAQFKTESEQIAYGDGYYAVYPRGVNCVNATFDLTFSNRTTREASSIMHFLENKLGQHEVDAPSDHLEYKQGISGFFWGGDSMFFPYNSTENLSKRFVCLNFGHNLVSENSNTVSCSLENFDTSILRKSEQIWVDRVDSWNENSSYGLNDIVFLENNHQFYYCSGSNASSVDHPTGINGVPTANNPWTREFFWKPSLGLSVQEAPRLRTATLGFSNYKQIYNDGINESLLAFDLELKDRNEKETKAILHFLETRHGTKSFSYTLPSPYDSRRRFLAPEWSHTYVFKDTHNIKASLVEFPFNFSDEEFDNIVTDTPLRGAELNAPRLVTMGLIEKDEKRRCRIEVKNFGDKPIYNLSLSNPAAYDKSNDLYSFAGVSINHSNSQWVDETSDNLTSKDRAVIDHLFDATGFGKIRISPNLANGPEGGIYFSTLSADGAVTGKFFQSNQGHIMVIEGEFPSALVADGGYLHGKTLTSKLTKPLPYINKTVISNNPATALNPGETCYFEVVFNNLQELEDTVEVAQFTIQGTWDNAVGGPVAEYTNVLVLAFGGSKWRAHQLNESSSRYTGSGTVKLDKLTVTSETKNTNPYVYYDGNFDGKINLVVDHKSLKILDDVKDEQWVVGGESVIQWAVSINGGRSWRMKSAIVVATTNHTRGETRNDAHWTFPSDLSRFKENWGNAEAGNMNIAVCDIVGEDTLGMTVEIPFAGAKPKYGWSWGQQGESDPNTEWVREETTTTDVLKAFNQEGNRGKIFQGS